MFDPWEYSAFHWANRADPFSVEAALRWPSAWSDGLGVEDHPRRRKRIAVVGGGIAGLAAGYELARLGHSVTVFESSDRWGGRIYTHRFTDGTYGELGAMRIPHSHGYVWHYIEEFDLAHRTFVALNAMGFRAFRGQSWVRAANVGDLAHAFGVMGFEHSDPRRIIKDLKAKVDSVLERAGWENLSNTPSDPALVTLSDMTAGEFARGGWRTVVGAASELSADASQLLQQFEIPQARDVLWEYAARVGQQIWLEHSSALHWLREATLIDEGGKSEIVGGMDLLVNAFLERLRNRTGVAADSASAPRPPRLRLRTAASEIAVSEGGVRVFFKQPGRDLESEMFDYLICATPPAATRRIQFSPPLDPRKADALGSLSHLAAGKTLMRCRKRHWELEDHIVGGGSFTDLLNQQCWYPSDNATPVKSQESVEADQIIAAQLQEITEPGMGGTPPHYFETDRWEMKSREVANEPAVFLAAYMWGENARRFASFDTATRDKVMCDAVRTIHRQNDDLLEDIVHWSWDEQSNPGGGAFAWFGPGQHRRHQAALCEPIRDERDNARVFFAGEHTGLLHGWIQSSLQSAIAAAAHVLNAP